MKKKGLLVTGCRREDIVIKLRVDSNLSDQKQFNNRSLNILLIFNTYNFLKKGLGMREVTTRTYTSRGFFLLKPQYLGPCAMCANIQGVDF